MAKVNENIMKDWLDGEPITAKEYKKERQIITLANNDNHERLTVIESELPRLDEAEERLATAEEELSNRYTKDEVDNALVQKADQAIVYTKAETDFRISQPNVGFIDGGNFTDVYTSQFKVIDGGDF